MSDEKLCEALKRAKVPPKAIGLKDIDELLDCSAGTEIGTFDPTAILELVNQVEMISTVGLAYGVFLHTGIKADDVVTLFRKVHQRAVALGKKGVWGVGSLLSSISWVSYYFLWKGTCYEAKALENSKQAIITISLTDKEPMYELLS